MCALTAKDSNYPGKAACLEFCTLKGQTPLSVSRIISTTCSTSGSKAVNLPRQTLDVFLLWLFLLDIRHLSAKSAPAWISGRCGCSPGMPKMWVSVWIETGPVIVFSGCKKNLLLLFFLNVWFSLCQNYLDSIAVFAAGPHIFMFTCAGCIEMDSLCAAPFCVLLVRAWTRGRYLTKARCLLYYQHELHKHKRLQSFIQWHWGAVGGYIKAPYLSPPILMRNRTHQPWLNLPSVCLFFLSLACLWFVCVVVLYICLCKVAPWCQGPIFMEFYVQSNCSKSLFSRGRPLIFEGD